MKTKKTILIIFLIISLVGFLTTSTLAKEIRVAHDESADPDNASHALMLTIQAFLETTTDIKVNIFPDGVLGDETATVEQLQDGDIHIAQLSMGGLGYFYDRGTALNTPFVYILPDMELVEYLYQGNTQWMQNFFAEIEEEVGIVPFSMFIRGGPSHISTANRPINSLEDFQGFTFRAMDESQVAFFESLGASAEVVPFEELYTALQTGIVEGQRNPIHLFLDQSLDEVQDYIMDPPFVFGNSILVASPDWYYNLSEEDRNAVDFAVERGIDVAHGVSRRGIEKNREAARERGVEFVEVSQENFEEIMSAVEEGMMDWAYERYGDEWTMELMEEMRRLADMF